MYALGIFAYLLGSLAVAGVVTLAISLFRSMQNNDNFKSWRVMMGLSFVCAALPYAYIEVMTAAQDHSINQAVVKGLKSAGVNGKLAYYKVVKSDPAQTELIVVAKEKTTLNPAESCVLRMTVAKKGKDWKATKYEFIDSFKRGKDSFTFPPYW